MDPSLGFLILITVTLIGSFLTAIENALSSLGKVRITALLKEHQKHRRFLQELMDQHSLIVTSVTFVRDLAIAIAAITALSIALTYFPGETRFLKAIIGIGILALSLILIGGWIPKYMSRDKMGSWVVRYMTPIHLLTRPIMPILKLLDALKRFILKLLGMANGDDDKRTLPVGEDQIKFLLEAAEEHGLLDEQEERMIWRILAYDDLVVRQVMVPRPEVIALSVDTAIEEAKEIIEEHGFSRYPVYESTTDNIIGMLYAKDLLRFGSTEKSLEDLVRQAFFTPTIKPINNLLQEFQRHKKHIAIVVDEFGSMAGIVTLEDILEEIVGEIDDEYDQPEEAPIRKLSKNEYLVEGDTELSTLNEQLTLDLPLDGAVTIGGLITQHLEEIPEKGRSLEISDIRVLVEEATAREIVKVRLRLPESIPAAQGS